MNLVLDTLFCDSLEFTVSMEDWATIPPMPSMEQTVVALCEFVGIELISYERAQIMPNTPPGFYSILIVGESWVRQKQR